MKPAHPLGMSYTQHQNTVRRAAMPEVLFCPDIGLALTIHETEACSLVLEGKLGSYFLVGGQPAVLRKDFIDALSRRSLGPDAGKEVFDAQ